MSYSAKRFLVTKFKMSLKQLWCAAALMDTLNITQSGVALLDTMDFHEIQIVNQYDSYSCLYRCIGERIVFLLLQVSTLYVR